MSDTPFYVLKGRDVGGPLNYIPGEYNQEAFEWEAFALEPEKLVIAKTYTYTVTSPNIKQLDFDFYGTSHPIVSDRFVAVCEALQVKFRTVPLSMILDGEAVTAPQYFMFLPGEYRYILDTARSTFKDDIDYDTGELAHNMAFPGGMSHAWIKHFAVLPDSTPHLFWCADLMAVVVARAFKEKAEEARLVCLEFEPIDENFRYDPWDEIDDVV